MRLRSLSLALLLVGSLGLAACEDAEEDAAEDAAEETVEDAAE